MTEKLKLFHPAAIKLRKTQPGARRRFLYPYGA